MKKILMIIVCGIVFAGCATSKIFVMSLNIPHRPNVILGVEKIPIPEQVYYAVGNYYESYSIEDIENFRLSLIRSIRKGNYFKEVQDLSRKKPQDTDIILEFKFTTSGITNMWIPTCKLNGQMIAKGNSGNILKSEDFHVSCFSFVTAPRARNGAARKLIKKTAIFLSTLNNELRR